MSEWVESREKAQNAEKEVEFQRRAADETTKLAAQMARMKAAEAAAAARRTKPGDGFLPS